MLKSKTFSLIIKTQAGLEETLAAEVAQYGGQDIEILTRAVKCKADNTTMYRLNYCCRTALRILKEIHEFEITNQESLYTEIKSIDWFSLLGPDQSLAVNATVSNSQFTHSHYVSLRTKDAIVDKFREKFDKRPNVDLENPDLRIHIHIYESACTVLLDSSGDSLHKRGYRTHQGMAPINEVLAAGMIKLSGWDGKTDLLDPMCGSATILCEANMISRNIPAGFYRRHFGFFKWADFDEGIWNQIVVKENASIRKPACRISGSDLSIMAVNLAKEVIKNADFTKDIEVKQMPFEDSTPPNVEGGIIITNPPYGERIQKDDLNAFYKMIGDVLKSKYAGYQAWLITSDFGAMKSVGLKTSRKIKLYNGQLECRYVKYELYRGSKKAKKQAPAPQD